MRFSSWFYRTARRQPQSRPRGIHTPHLEVLEDRTVPSAYLVTSLGDAGTGSGSSGDLRYCLTQANSTPGTNTINFAVAGTIDLHSELPNLSSNIVLVGPRTGSLTVQRDQGATAFSVFTVDAVARVSISDLTITGGQNDGTAGSSGNGGGIANYGTLVLSNSTLAANSAINGGGIYDAGDLTITNSTIGDYTVANSNNLAANSAANGGGIWSNSPASLANVTVTGNQASTTGGGIDVAGGRIVLCNTLVGNNVELGGISGSGVSASSYNDISGSVDASSSFNNLISDGSGGLDPVRGNILGPLNGPLELTYLGDYGGPTPTCDLLPNSPALGKGSTVFVAPGENDQRGEPRIVNGTVDIGAVQSQGFSLTAVAGSGQTTPPLTDFAIHLQARVEENGHGLPGAEVTYTAPTSGATGTFWDIGPMFPIPTGLVPTNSIGWLTNASGVADPWPFTANGILGTYTVTAAVSGIPYPVTFTLTNGTASAPSGPGNTGVNLFPSALPNAVHQQLNLNMLAMPLWNNPQGEAWLADQFWMWYGLAFLQSPQQANLLFWQEFNLTRDLFQARGSMAQLENSPQAWGLAHEIAANPLYNTPVGYGMALLESEWLLASAV
jgi:hypothetical protein